MKRQDQRGTKISEIRTIFTVTDVVFTIASFTPLYIVSAYDPFNLKEGEYLSYKLSSLLWPKPLLIHRFLPAATIWVERIQHLFSSIILCIWTRPSSPCLGSISWQRSWNVLPPETTRRRNCPDRGGVTSVLTVGVSDAFMDKAESFNRRRYLGLYRFGHILIQRWTESRIIVVIVLWDRINSCIKYYMGELCSQGLVHRMIRYVHKPWYKSVDLNSGFEFELGLTLDRSLARSSIDYEVAIRDMSVRNVIH